MDREESIVMEYLKSMGHTDIVYEPDGNIPPDFLINGKIAVEVRRLNQHFRQATKAPEPLESLTFSIIPKIVKILKDFSTYKTESSAFITVQYSRPIRNEPKLLREVKDILTKHLDNIPEVMTEYQISKNFKIIIIPSSEKFENPFVFGGYSDMDSGGFIVSEIYENLKIVIEEKSGKITSVRSNYKIWWLILEDRIGYGSGQQGLEKLRELLYQKYSWDKIILINPSKPNNALEI